jgi:putative MATE family efflux protein
MQTQARIDPRSARPGVWQLAWPAVLTNLLQSLVGLIDIKVVGSLGFTAVAGAATGHRLFFALQAVLMAVAAGTTALVARAWGAGDREEAARVVGSSLVLGSAVAAVMGLVGFAAAAPFAAMFGLEGEAARLAAIYIRWISAFNVVFALGFVLGTGLRATGDTRTPLLIGAVSNVANALLLYALVHGGFGAPRLGIAGAAISGGGAFAVGTTLGLALWWRGKLALAPTRGGLLDGQRIRRLIAIGYPAALEQLVFQLGFVAFTFVIARFHGTTALAAYGIGVQILSLSFVVGFGFSIAASTLVGQHLGAGDPARAAQSGWRAMALAIGSMSMLSVVIVAAARPIAELMISDTEVVRLTVVFIYLLGAAQPLMAVEFALGGALRGAGDTRFPLATTFAGLIGVRLVLAVVFTWLGLSVEWIYGALLADYVVKAGLMVARFRSGRWQHAIAPTAPGVVAAPASVQPVVAAD